MCLRSSSKMLISLTCWIIPFLFVTPVQAQKVTQVSPVDHNDQPVFWIPNAGSGWIDFVPTEGGQIFITVVLNGDHVRALIDTGFDQIVVSKAYADAHTLPLTRSATPISFGGATPYYATPGVALDIGAIRTIKPGSVTVLDFSQLTNLAMGQFDVVIGLPVLASMEWQVDQDNHRFRLMKSGTIPLPLGIPIRVGPDNSRLVTDVAINGKSVSPAMIDTGSDSEISLTATTAKAVGFVAATDMQSIGAGGSVVQPFGRATNFSIGTHAIKSVYADVVSGDWAPGIPAMIGMGLLRSYNTSVDLPMGRMVLSARTTPLPTPPKSTSGVQGDFQGGRLTITHVMRNSPAAAAELKAGDQICAINGEQMSQNMIDRHWGRAAPGTEYTLKLCDGSVRAMTLRSFY